MSYRRRRRRGGRVSRRNSAGRGLMRVGYRL